jgi:hypothetical protein
MHWISILFTLYHSLFFFYLHVVLSDRFTNTVMCAVSTYICIYAYICICVYLWIYLSYRSSLYIWRKTWHLSFWVWLTLFNLMISTSIHLFAKNLITFYGWKMLHCVCIYHIFLVHSSIVGHLGWFQSLAIVSSVAINISVQMALLYPDLYSFRYIFRSSITIFYSRPIFILWGTSTLLSIVVALIYLPTNIG